MILKNTLPQVPTLIGHPSKFDVYFPNNSLRLVANQRQSSRSNQRFLDDHAMLSL